MHGRGAPSPAAALDKVVRPKGADGRISWCSGALSIGTRHADIHTRRDRRGTTRQGAQEEVKGKGPAEVIGMIIRESKHALGPRRRVHRNAAPEAERPPRDGSVEEASTASVGGGWTLV